MTAGCWGLMKTHLDVARGCRRASRTARIRDIDHVVGAERQHRPVAGGQSHEFRLHGQVTVRDLVDHSPHRAAALVARLHVRSNSSWKGGMAALRWWCVEA